MSDLFIPTKIRVGFQKRDDTYTKKLAYVIYYDAKGVLRKETSWQSWRDKNIKPEEFENKPQDGFHLNKDVKRFNWSHFGTNRSYIRVYDSRGIEFEITPENLIGILTETDCSRRGLSGEFVYAWKGTELVLLPCCSQEYKDAQNYTALQSQDISARDLKPGFSYTTKKGDEVIYLGRFYWFEWKYDRNSSSGYDRKIVSSKKHIFAHGKKPDYGSLFFPKSDASFLAVLNSPDAVANYADLIDKWNASPNSSTVKEWDVTPLKFDANVLFAHAVNGNGRKDNNYTMVDGDDIHFYNLSPVYANYGETPSPNHDAFQLTEVGTLNRKTMQYSYARNEYDSWSYGRKNKNAKTREQIVSQLGSFSRVKAVLASGKKIELKTFCDLDNYS